MDLLSYKCPCCASPLTFDNESGKMHCQSCDNSFEVETLKKYDAAIENKDDDYDWGKYEKKEFDESEAANIKTYICQSCGGEIITDGNTAATRCPYCDNVQIMPGQLSGEYKPDFVVPFKLSKKDAQKRYEQFCEGKKLLPSLFTSKSRIESISGVYVPFWIFEGVADADVTYHGTKVNLWSDSQFEYIDTQHYSIIRNGKLSFDRIPVDGSKRIDNTYMEAIEPFDLSEAKDFQTAYLSGYLAEKFDVDAEECKPRANERIKNSTEQHFRQTVVGDYNSLQMERSNIKIENGEVKYGLLPVWLLNTKYDDKIYTFAMNGQTGKFVGELPVDKSKKTKYFWKIFAIIDVILIIIALIFFL